MARTTEVERSVVLKLAASEQDLMHYEKFSHSSVCTRNTVLLPD